MNNWKTLIFPDESGETNGNIAPLSNYSNDYDDFGGDYISPLEAFEDDEDLYNEWLLNT